MSEGTSPQERDFRVLVYRNRALLYETAMTSLKAFLGPQWSYRLEDEAQRGLLAVKSPLMYVIKGEYEIPLTINTRGNQLRILLSDGEVFHDLKDMASELERIVAAGRAPTNKEVASLKAERRLEINRRRGFRKAKNGHVDEVADDQSPVEPKNELIAMPTKEVEPRPLPISNHQMAVRESKHDIPPSTGKRSSSVAQTPLRPIHSIYETYLQHDYDAMMKALNGDSIQSSPLDDDPKVRVRRYSLLSRVQGVFRRINDIVTAKPGGGHNNIRRFVAVIQEKVANGTTFSLEQYEAMCEIIRMLRSEVLATNPPPIVQSDFDRLIKEIEVF